MTWRTVRAATAPAAPPAEAAARPSNALVEALTGLRGALAEARFPLPVPGAGPAATAAAKIVRQLDDYLLPRLTRPDAPLLVVVGGPTGAGKSTLINSVVRAPVTPSGVLRPTTMAPVLVSHPADSTWFAEGGLLPGLPRTTGLTGAAGSLRLVSAPGMVPGLALLDTPDIDSVVEANRDAAEQLLAAADLWLFVTTAARYGDAVPWEVLRTAGERSTALAIVLDRVPPGAESEIAGDLDALLERNGLVATRRFVLPETTVDGQGLLAERLMDPLCAWLAELATDTGKRADVVRQTVHGAVAALAPSVDRLAAAADDQVAAAAALEDGVRGALQAALIGVDRSASDGTLLRGEALTRWQEFVGGGQLVRALQTHLGRLRDRVGAALSGRETPGRELRDALLAGLVTVVTSGAADAEDQARAAWRGHPDLLAAVPPVEGAAVGAERAIRLWQRAVQELVRRDLSRRRRSAPPQRVAATTLLVLIAVFSARSFAPTPAEMAVAGDLAGSDRALLDRVFGDQTLRDLAWQARAELVRRVRELLEARLGRYLATLDAAGVPAGAPDALRSAARATSAALAPADAVPAPDGAVPGPGGTGTPRGQADATNGAEGAA